MLFIDSLWRYKVSSCLKGWLKVQNTVSPDSFLFFVFQWFFKSVINDLVTTSFNFLHIEFNSQNSAFIRNFEKKNVNQLIMHGPMVCQISFVNQSTSIYIDCWHHPIERPLYGAWKTLIFFDGLYGCFNQKYCKII